MRRDFGKKATFVFDRELDASTLRASDFAIVDDRGVRFVPLSVSLDSDFMTVRLTFYDFNAAHGVCRAVYTPGTLKTMAGYTAVYTEYSFTPVGLVPPTEPAPAPVSAYNVGQTVFVTFDAELISDFAPGVLSSFKARFQTRTFAPDGDIVTVERTPIQLLLDNDGKIVLTFGGGNQNDLSNALGDISIVYDGSGGLTGDGNPVVPFTQIFTPAGLVQKPDQRHAEHIDISDIAVSGTLVPILYHYGYEAEHIDISGITASGVLTNVEDI